MSDTQTTKVCTKCGVEKPVTGFEISRTSRGGRACICKGCRQDRRREYLATHPEKKAEKYAKKEIWRKSRDVRLRLIEGAKKRAKEKGLPFDMTIDDIPVPGACPVLGIPLLSRNGSPGIGSPSVDRKTGDRGYVGGPHSNVRVISHKANALKSDLSPVDSVRLALYNVECQAGYIAYLESEIERLKKAQ